MRHSPRAIRTRLAGQIAVAVALLAILLCMVIASVWRHRRHQASSNTFPDTGVGLVGGMDLPSFSDLGSDVGRSTGTTPFYGSYVDADALVSLEHRPQIGTGAIDVVELDVAEMIDAVVRTSTIVGISEQADLLSGLLESHGALGSEGSFGGASSAGGISSAGGEWGIGGVPWAGGPSVAGPGGVWPSDAASSSLNGDLPSSSLAEWEFADPAPMLESFDLGHSPGYDDAQNGGWHGGPDAVGGNRPTRGYGPGRRPTLNIPPGDHISGRPRRGNQGGISLSPPTALAPVPTPTPTPIPEPTTLLLLGSGLVLGGGVLKRRRRT